MATLADLFALKPSAVPRYAGSLADAVAGGWSGQGYGADLSTDPGNWSPLMFGKRGLSDMIGSMLPVELNGRTGEARMAVPPMVKALPDMPKALADMLQRSMSGDYQPTTEDPMTGRMYDPRQYEDAANLAGLISTGALPFPTEGALRAGLGPLWHPISDTKLRKPLAQLDNLTAPGGVPLNPEIPLNYENLLGQKLIGAVGDLSSAGRRVLRVDGLNLESPVITDGGKDFMRADRPGEVWANAASPASMFQRLIDKAGADGSGVNLVYTTMGHPAIDSSTMMGDTLAEVMKLAKVPKKSSALFDAEIRKRLPDFVGITSAKLPEYMRTATGAERNIIAKVMAKKEYAELRFPDVVAMRHALIAPDLLGTAPGMSGAAISKVQPGAALIRNPQLPHPTYDTHIAGDYAGSAPMVPANIMFPDWAASRAASNAGLKPGEIQNRDGRALMMSPPTQLANQQWLDGVMAYLATQKR